TRLDAILYTHAHADHILGLDDVRPISFKSEGKIPLYAQEKTAEAVESIFRYIFDANYKYGGTAPAGTKSNTRSAAVSSPRVVSRSKSCTVKRRFTAFVLAQPLTSLTSARFLTNQRNRCAGWISCFLTHCAIARIPHIPRSRIHSAWWKSCSLGAPSSPTFPT